MCGVPTLVVPTRVPTLVLFRLSWGQRCGRTTMVTFGKLIYLFLLLDVVLSLGLIWGLLLFVL